MLIVYTRTSIVDLTEMDRTELNAMIRSQSLLMVLALRTRIMLACEGPNRVSTKITEALGVVRTIVNKWRGSYV